MIRAVAQRNIHSAADTVLQTAKNPDKKVRIESQKTLRQIANPAQLKNLVNLLINIEDAGEKKDDMQKFLNAPRGRESIKHSLTIQRTIARLVEMVKVAAGEAKAQVKGSNI